MGFSFQSFQHMTTTNNSSGMKNYNSKKEDLEEEDQ